MLKDLNKKFKALCTPASVYFVISFVSIVIMIVQNYNSPHNKYCVGSHHCSIDSPSYKVIFFVVKIMYVLFWTWILNVMCNTGYKDIAWFLVLLPIVGMFVIIAALLTINK